MRKRIFQKAISCLIFISLFLMGAYSCGKSEKTLSDEEVVRELKSKLSEMAGYEEVKLIEDGREKTIYVSRRDFRSNDFWKGYEFSARFSLEYNLLEAISEIASKNDTISKVELEMETKDSSLL